ncbi:hypothetical protein B0T22DRAFT_301064 [Podospora appendiculata]|uniref:Uncharacterized protein n=1 Tax=Podospora appendiculata TaxID=314037 RepID=A0AAE0X045_9PEZI|nr:hypothetical protein B0T22DRAFT_301064 [Podospora appendiculata]
MATTASALSLSCAPGSTMSAFPHCDFWQHTSDVCGPVTPKEKKKECLCQQPVIDSLYGCESELRLCFLDHDMDSGQEEAISLWHSVCDTFVTVPITTASVVALTTTMDQVSCIERVQDACSSAKMANSECATLTGDAEFSSCVCDPQKIRNEYTCEYLYDVSCNSKTGDVSTMLAATLCDNFNSVIASATASATVSTVHLTDTVTSTTLSPGSTISTSGPELTTTTEPTPTTDSITPDFTITTAPTTIKTSTTTKRPAVTTTTTGSGAEASFHTTMLSLFLLLLPVHMLIRFAM